MKTSSLVSSVVSLLALCAFANQPAYNVDTPVSANNLDQEAFQSWDPGAEPHLQPVGNVREAIWAKDTGTPVWCGTTFATSRTVGTRHLRIGFIEPVEIGSILVRGWVGVSVLKPEAEYPGDVTDDSQWIPASRLATDGVTTAEAPSRESVEMWTLPAVTATRAIRFTHTATPDQNDLAGYLGGAIVLSDRWANYSRFATAASRSNNSSASRICDGYDNGWGCWENMNGQQAASRQPVSEENAEWLMLHWPSALRFDAVLTCWTGIGAMEIQRFDASGVHPLDAAEDAWKQVAYPKDFESGYPIQLWPCFAPFDNGTVDTRALRIRATAVSPVGHPHVSGNTIEGKRVWLGEILVLRKLGDEPLAAPVFKEPEIPHAPIPVKFKTPADGYVTLVIEKEDGTRVRNLVSETWFPKGENTAWWDGSDDLLRDEDAQNHGLWHIPTNFVEPGKYRVRGLWHAGIEPVYEFSVYAPGNPPWDLDDHTGAWLANHSAPQSAAFTPADRSPFGEPAVFLGAYVTEGPDGLLWADLDANKRGGMRWIGGLWTAAPFLCCDRGPNADTNTMVYVAAVWHDNDKPVELRLNNIFRNQGGGTQSGNIYTGPFAPFDGAAEQHGISFELSSIAAWNRNVYCSVPGTNRIVRVDATGDAAKIADSLEIACPKGLAIDADGTILVASGNTIVRVTPASDGVLANAVVSPVVTTGLEDPQQIAIAENGEIFVGDWGASHQVKVFSRDGSFLRAIGHPGVPTTGKYDELHMNNPAGLAIDSRGQLWVAENNFIPKRISVWNAGTGALVKAVYGPGKYGGGGMLATDNSERFIYADENRGTMEFAIDWKTGDSKLVNIPYRASGNDVVTRVGVAAPEHVFTYRKHRYYSNTYDSNPVAGSSAVLFQERDGVAIPVAAIGSANWGTAVRGPDFADRWPPRNETESEPDPTQSVSAWYLWSDANGDADIQPSEVEIRRGGLQGVNVLEDLSFAISRVDSTAYRLRPSVIGKNGAPLYDLAKLETVATNVYWSYSSGGGQMLMDDSDEAVLTLGVAPFSPYSVTGVKAGRPVWSIPNPWPGLHASHNCDVPRAPGQLIGVTRMLGGLFNPKGSKVGPLWGVNANMGNMYIITRDGLFVTTVFRDVRTAPLWRMPVAERGAKVGHISLHDENFWPTLTCLPNGKTYIVNGANSAICRLDGLETLRPIKPFTVEVTRDLVDKAIAYEAECEAIRRAARGTGMLHAVIRDDAPVVDGDIADWSTASWVEIDKAGMGANFNSESRPYSFLGAVAVAGDRLYAAWDTSEKQLLRNSGEMPNALFKTGGALDLMFGTDPNADPKRASAVAGDKRLTITRVGDAVKALLYTQVVPGTPDDQKVPFSSPWRTISFDKVEDVSDQVQLADNGNGGYEISVPLAVIGIAPTKGMAISADIGVLRGDGASTTARSYWSNKATGITADVPSEAELQPGFWGRMVFE